MCLMVKTLVVMDIILVIMEDLELIITKEVMEVLDMDLLVMEILNTELIKVIIREVEEAIGIQILVMEAIIMADHLDRSSLSGMVLNQPVKYVSRLDILQISVGNLQSSLILEHTDHHQIEIQKLHIWLTWRDHMIQTGTWTVELHII